MNYIELIIKIGACITALGIITGLVVKLWKHIKKFVNRIDNFVNMLDDLERHTKENYISLLRLTIMSNEMPIGERIMAGYKYLEAGGNGEVKSYLKKQFNIDETVDEADHYKKTH